jgi:2-polyprenyl-3-methyl-5-hydroxy-6-metoxy-1,4-benzoquinol methylase
MKKNRELNASYYDKVYAKSFAEKSEYFQPPDKCYYFPLWDKALSFISKQARILDLGCGPGQFEQLAFDRGYNVVRAVDFSTAAINNARKINPKHTDIFFTRNLADGTVYLLDDYDVVVLFEVLEHINNDLAILSKIFKGKKVIFSVPTFLCLGHVRCFPKVEDVIARYKTFLTNIVIEKITVDKHFIWLLSAEKA